MTLVNMKPDISPKSKHTQVPVSLKIRLIVYMVSQLRKGAAKGIADNFAAAKVERCAT